MGRQRFLHHYLPAHLASTLVAAAVVELLCNVDPVQPPSTITDDPAGKTKTKRPDRFITAKERLGRKSLTVMWVATGVILAAVVYGFLHYAPLTYGSPLDVAGVKARKWLNYDLHFAK